MGRGEEMRQAEQCASGGSVGLLRPGERETENGDAADELCVRGRGGREKVAVAQGQGTGKLVRK
jgi:hypothetical protein